MRNDVQTIQLSAKQFNAQHHRGFMVSDILNLNLTLCIFYIALRRYIAILFLLLLSAVGYLIALSCQWEIKQVKRFVKQALADGIIECDKIVVFRKSEINNATWIEPFEFRLGSNMYDVFKTDTVGKEVTYFCILDNKEGIWVNLLRSVLQNEQPFTKNRDLLPLKFLLKDLIFYCEIPHVNYFPCSLLIITCCSYQTAQSFAMYVFIPPEII